MTRPRRVDDRTNLDFTVRMLGWLRRRYPTVSDETVRLLLLLAAIDLLLIAIHATHVRYDVPGSGRWLISRDRGIPELFQYGKEASIVVLLLLSYRRVRSPIHLAWAATFTYFLIDDAIEVHETIGEAIADVLNLGQPLGIEGRDAGQVLFSASVGVALVIAIVAATRGDRSVARPLTMRLFPLLVALGFFGVVADVIDIIDVLGLVEDGGEMAVMTVATVVAADHWRGLARPPDPNRLSPAATVAGDSTQPV